MTVLRQRLQARASDSTEEIQRRLQKVKEEVWSYREYAYIVRNDDLTARCTTWKAFFSVRTVENETIEHDLDREQFHSRRGEQIRRSERSSLTEGEY